MAAKLWERVSEERYYEMLEVLPPAVWLGHGFMVGEPWDHSPEGLPRFQAFVQLPGCSGSQHYYGALRPMTEQEFRALTPGAVLMHLGDSPCET